MKVSDDPTARALLVAWAKKPWDRAARFALADRLEELGLPQVALVARTHKGASVGDEARRLPRRARQRILRQWKSALEGLFGPLEPNTLPCEVPADTDPIEPPF